MLRTFICRALMATVLTLSVTVGWATPEQQYAFAHQLMKDGESAFAYLEFKRMIAQYPEHAKSADAKLKLATLYITHRKDIKRARTALTELQEAFPGSEVARKAAGMQAFVDANMDHNGKPLIRLLRGKAAESREEFGQAASLYTRLVKDWPESGLAEQALLDSARLRIEQLDQAKSGLKQVQQFVARYPQSPRIGQAEYLAALANEQIEGPTQQTVANYNLLLRKYPNTPVATQAKARLLAIRNAANRFERQFDKQWVRQYSLLKDGVDSKGTYVVIVQLPTDINRQEVEATMEQALIDRCDKRPDNIDRVYVDAYFNYPLTKAGNVSWTAGKKPVYRVKKRKSEDVLKDVFINILKQQ